MTTVPVGAPLEMRRLHHVQEQEQVLGLVQVEHMLPLGLVRV